MLGIWLGLKLTKNKETVIVREVPAPQSYEFWHALKTLGVKTRLVIYPGEGHFMAKPEHQRDVARRMVEWFNEHLK